MPYRAMPKFWTGSADSRAVAIGKGLRRAIQGGPGGRVSRSGLEYSTVLRVLLQVAESRAR